jgi:drug/metabolite transporter (DMT)-like permease
VNDSSSARAWVSRIAPGLFVVLWSSGFIGAKFGLPYAEPFTFLLIRLSLVATILVTVAFASRAPWPRRWRDAGHVAVAGLLVHGAYLGGVFAAIAGGMSAGLTALIVGLQPLITAALVGRLFGDRVTARQWMGLVMGLFGIWLVVSQKVGYTSEVGPWLWTFLALFGITAGTLYQKRFCTGMDLRTGTAIQYMATCVLLALLATGNETMQVQWTPSFLFALAWLIFVLSVGAVFLLFILIREGQAARVASLFYLTPPTVALMAWLLFGETLSLTALAGFAVVAGGVALARN